MDSFIDSCLLCQSFQLGARFFCRSCERQMLESELIFRHEKDLDIFSLLHYVVPAQGFLKLCKKKKLAEFTKELARILARKISYELLEPVCGVIPMPAKIFGEQDHAYWIAEAVADYFRVPITSHFLERTSSDAQKEKTVTERSQLKLLCREPESLPILKQRGIWILVDDVVTTGSTVLTAWRVLGRPSALALTLGSTPRHSLGIFAS